MAPDPRPLLVTGYSMLHALGGTRDDVCAKLRVGQSGLVHRETPHFETYVGQVDTPLDPLPKALAPWDTRIARMAAYLVAELEEPLRRARERWRPERIGVILGTSTAGAETTERGFQQFVATGKFPTEYDFHHQHTYGAVLHVVGQLAGAHGPAWMISTACTSSAKSVATAHRLIEAGMIDAAIVGGLDTLCSMTLAGFYSLAALDAKPCRPFSSTRLGINIGEGGGLVLVERDGDPRVLVEGIGETSDAYHLSHPHPEGLGAEASMRGALAQAGLQAEDVDYVNAHGTGTQVNDGVEAGAIERVFGTTVPVVSTKGYTGHTLGAAGVVEFIFAALAVEEGWLPPSIHADPRDPDVHIHVSDRFVEQKTRRAISNSFAFGGNNVSVLVGEP